VNLDGVWLGLCDRIPADCPEVRIQLAAGDVMLFYTDGLVERMNEAGSDMFGYRRLAETLEGFAKKETSHMVDGILKRLDLYSKVQDDDVTLLAIKYNGVTATLGAQS
jgi:phosphoserine phosphatase RsbU/P